MSTLDKGNRLTIIRQHFQRRISSSFFASNFFASWHLAARQIPTAALFCGKLTVSLLQLNSYCYTSPCLFFDTGACMFLYLSSKCAVTLVGFVWLLFQDSVTPVYKAAMWFPQLPSFHSKRPGSQCGTVSAIHPRLLRDSALLKRTSLSPCSPSSARWHNHGSVGAAFFFCHGNSEHKKHGQGQEL